MIAAYYNENDPYAAEWLRNLIKAGHIAPGFVDERDIRDVRSEDLEGFSQHHFFAGIGVWSHALRLAGWPDDRPIWTGSCPCQPFSGAGKRGGFADERHLWPAWFDLIRERRPGVCIGEQVASPDGLGWWDSVQDHLENADYASAALDLCVPGVGGSHIRQRLYWMAYADGLRFKRVGGRGTQKAGARIAERGEIGGMADADIDGCNQGRASITTAGNDGAIRNGTTCRMGNTTCHEEREHRASKESAQPQEPSGRSGIPSEWSSPLNGFWRDADWLFCRDGKWRPVEPGTFPLAHGITAKVGQLRAYGNAIVAPQAAEFVKAVSEELGYA